MASATLQITSGEHAGQTFLLEGRMIVGRDHRAHIRINDRSISRKHAQIEERDGGFYVTDLDSHNGTRLNGVPLTESLLPGSCSLQFGNVQAEFTIVSSDPLPAIRTQHDEPGWESLAPGDPSLDDVFSLPGSLDEIDQREAVKKSEAQRKLYDLGYIALMLLILAGGAVLFFSVDDDSSTAYQSVWVQRYSEKLTPYLGKYGFDRIIVDDPAVADVQQDEDYTWLLKIRGIEIGETKAKLVSSAGKIVGMLTIVVKSEPEAEEPPGKYLPESECIREATQLVRQGDSLAKEAPWQALQMYERAVEYCRTLDSQPSIYLDAMKKANQMRDAINERADYLLRQARAARSEPAAAVRYLNDIRRLIPDPDDPRHQRAQIIINVHFSEMTHKPLKRR